MRKPLSSCFDCVLLHNHKNPKVRDFLFWCAGYNKQLTYDFARTPNDCPRKRQDNDLAIQVPRDEILDRFYKTCVEFAEQLGRPFTMRELFEHVDYLNKNSLWELMEILVKSGKLEKSDGTMRTWRGQVYEVKTYFPNFGVMEKA